MNPATDCPPCPDCRLPCGSLLHARDHGFRDGRLMCAACGHEWWPEPEERRRAWDADRAYLEGEGLDPYAAEPQWFTVEVCAPLPRSRWAELGRCWTGWVGLDPSESFPPYVACIDGAWLPSGMGPARPTGRAGAVALAEAYEGAGYRARVRPA